MIEVVILRSISGAGKTTLAESLTEKWLTKRGALEGSATTVSTDNFYIVQQGSYCDGSVALSGSKDGEYRFDARKLHTAHQMCLRDYTEALLGAVDEGIPAHIIVDNTNIRYIEFVPYHQLAQAYNCSVQVITIVCEPDLAFNGAVSNGHKTPMEIIWRQHQRLLAEQLPPWLKQRVHVRRNLKFCPRIQF